MRKGIVRRNGMTEEKEIINSAEGGAYQEIISVLDEMPGVPLPDEQDFAYRLRALRTEVLRCDWTCDKYLSLPGNKGYPYMSSDKCRRNLAPLIAKHGFEFIPEFSDLKREELYGNVTNHWSVKLRGTLYDAFTGRSISATVYGENGSSDDKGIIKAQTAAIKQWILSVFLLADGVDVDAPEPVATGTFVKKEEAEEVKSKVLSQGVKPSEPAKPRKPEPKKEEPKPEPKKEEPKQDEPAEAVKESEKEPESEAESASESKVDAGMVELPKELAPIHRNAITKIVERYTEKAKNGEMDPETFNKMSIACAGIKTKADAVAFIKQFQVM